MQKSLVVAALFLAAVSAACGKKDAPAPAPAATGSAATVAPSKPAAAAVAAPSDDAFSCRTKEGLCIEWTALALTDLADAQESCNDPGDSFDSHGCSKQNLLGTCNHPSDKTKMYLYKSDVIGTVAEAKSFCDDGVFAPAAGTGKAPAKQASH